MAAVMINRFGRRGGRGFRPWLLAPKVLAVAVFLGSLAATGVIWAARAGLAADDSRRPWLIDVTGLLFRTLVVPSLLLAILMGGALLLQHPRVFLRMRWFLAKLACLAVFVPAAHFWLSSRLALARAAAGGGGIEAAAERQFMWGACVALVGFAVVIVLGRIKPRLGRRK